MSVLYGATEADGAIAEINFHLSRGQPIFPSKIRHDLFELNVKCDRALILANMEDLRRLGVEDNRYRELLYGRTQEIAAAAAFLGFDGIVAPSARWACQTIVLFLDSIDLEDVKQISVAPIDWVKWRNGHA
jgi:hypothetical protein